MAVKSILNFAQSTAWQTTFVRWWIFAVNLVVFTTMNDCPNPHKCELHLNRSNVLTDLKELSFWLHELVQDIQALRDLSE